MPGYPPGMARAIWSGAISFGLVTIPVKAYTATKDHDVHFHQVDAKGTRVRMKKVSEKTGKPVEDVKMGFETSKGKIVTLEPEEVDALRPSSTRRIEVTDFVVLDDVDPVYYQKTYWLAPDGDAAKPAYNLLLTVMEDEQKVGIGTVVLRNRQHLTAVRPLDGALAMSTMRFADEVVPKSSIEALPRKSSSKPDAKQLTLARRIVNELATDWDPERYRDTYTEEVRKLIAKKAKGGTIEVEPEEDERAEVLDLMAALQASIESKKGRKAPAKRTATKKRAAKKRTARKRASKKTSSRKSA
jgi:DNA end-binding protein Ku